MNKYLHSSEEVILVPVPGAWISSSLVQPPADATDENSQTVFHELFPKKYDNSKDDFCIVPVMPAVPPYVDEKVLQESSKNIQISAPLKGRKSPYSNKSARGYRSGRRSSLIPCRKLPPNTETTDKDWVIAIEGINGPKYVIDFEKGDVFLRAKGCGMWILDDDLPFPAITLQSAASIYARDDQKVSEVRGVCFVHTSSTEMYVTGQIEANLAKVGLVCGNHPLGFWLYKNLEGDVSPLIQKTVSLFETYGDRRLESHLLTGLERLLEKKYDQTFAQKVVDAILPLYSDKKDLPSNDNKTFTKTSHIYTVPFAKMIKDGSFFNFEDFDLPEFNEDSLRKHGLVPTHEIYAAIKDLDKEFVNLVKLCGHLGFESGRCASVVHRSGYLWGSYADHQQQDFHCNAHADNLVVLTKTQCLASESKQVLAPLDFDMSFKKENAINFWAEKPVPDPTYVTMNMTAEFDCLMTDIGGYFATISGASNAIDVRKQPPGLLVNVLWLLRDCAVYEFYQGYMKVNQKRCKGNDISVDEIYKLVEEGLNESINENS